MKAQAGKVFTINGERIQKEVAIIYFNYTTSGYVVLEFSDGTLMSYNMNRLAYNQEVATKIQKPTVSAFRIDKHIGNVMQLSGVQPGAAIYIYDSNGKLMTRSTASDQQHTIDLGNLQKGVYLLHIGEQTVKFFKD